MANLLNTTISGSLNIGDGSADTRLIIKRLDSTVADDIQFYNGTTRVGEIGTKDTTWLRINQNTAKNIYTPRYIRADGGFFVDTTAKGIDGSGNFIGGTITGAGDANVSNWDTAYGWGDHSTVGYFRNNYNSGGDLNTDSNSGIYRFGNTESNRPGSITYGTLVTFNNTSDTGFQLVGDYHNTGLYWRGGNSSTFGGSGSNTSWFKIWHDGNDGSGSGLDADLLDGQHGSYYATASHNQSATTITSGTFAGGRYIFPYNSGITGASVPAYTNSHIEINTSSNHVPTLGFHRGGYSATALYEYDGQLYVKPWTTRAQQGLLLSTGNVGSYALPLSGGTLSGNVNLGNNNITNVNSLGFDDGISLFGGGDDSYLHYKSSDVGAGGIEFFDGNDAKQGYLFYDGDNTTPSFGLLDASGTWAVRIVKDGLVELRYDNAIKLQTTSTGIDILTGNIAVDSSKGFNNSGAWTRNQTPYGYIEFGPANTTWAHIYTDRANFYFNKNLYVNNNLVWNAGNDGAGSGLDADLLDGQQGSYYAQASLSNNKTYTSTANVAGSYMGGHYSSGGAEKPNSATFGSGKLKVAMLGSGNLGFGGTWNDVLWMSTYNGGDVKKSTAIVSSKYSDTDLWVVKQNYDSTTWGTGYKIALTQDLGSYLPLAGGVMSGNIGRSAHNSGFLVGGYDNVGANSVNTNPIFTIGTNYLPASTTLGNMYGIGYTHVNASFIGLTGASGWGMYVAADGDARVWLDGGNGNISHAGSLYTAGSGNFVGAISASNLSGTNTGDSNFVGSAFTSRNSGNPIAIDNANSNMSGYTNSSSAAGYADGGLFVAAYSTSWVSQIFSNFRTGELATRGKNSGTWQSWRTVLDSTNYSSYALPLSGGTLTGGLTGTTASFSGTVAGSNFSGTSSGTNTGDQTTVSGNSGGVAITGYGTSNFSFYQTSSGFAGFTGGWANYFIGNHGNGSNYYNTTIIFPFWGAPKYSRLESNNLTSVYDFWTTENLSSATLPGGPYLPLTGGTMSGAISFGTSNGYVNLSKGSFITFYENGNAHHGIGSRDNSGNEADDIRINSYGSVYVNLDSNSNNTSSADFVIGHHGGGTATISQLFKVDGENGNITTDGTLTTGGSITSGGSIFVPNLAYATIGGSASPTRDKLRVWNSYHYTIGMMTGYTFGSLGNEYAMSFQMNNNSARGFWWGDEGHNNTQGAMSLTTDGRLFVARNITVGHGETYTTDAIQSSFLNVYGDSATIPAATVHQSNESGDGLFVKAGSSDSADYVLRLQGEGGGRNVLYARANGQIGMGTETPNGNLNVIKPGLGGFEFHPENSTDTNLLMHFDRLANADMHIQTRAASHQFLIGPTEKMRLDASGHLIVYSLGSSTVAASDVRYHTGSKEIFYQTSSKRYKTDIINLESSLDKINALRPVRYKNIDTQEVSCGLIAEETVKIIPEVVFTKEIEGFSEPQVEGINYSDIVPFLIKSIQELKAEIELLKSNQN